MLRTATFLCVLLSFATLHAADDGTIDLTFGEGGIVLATLEQKHDAYVPEYVVPRSVLCPDGSIIATGRTYTSSIVLLKYTPDGAPDLLFGDNGVSTTDIPGIYEYSCTIALAASGKIYAVSGRFYDNDASAGYVLARFNADGSIDTAFGNAGTVTVRLSDGASAGAVLMDAVQIQPDGKILACGMVYRANFHWDVALVRFNEDGSVDSTFGDGGSKIFHDDSMFSNALAIQGDGKIIVGGGRYFPDHRSQIRILRMNPDGSPDLTFGDKGWVTLSPSPDCWVVSVLAKPDGKIIAALVYGISYRVFDGHQLARFNADGSLDTTFGEGGLAHSSTATLKITPTRWPMWMALQPDGKILFPAAHYNGDLTEPAVIRYEPDGAIDETFGTGGIATAPLLGNSQSTAVLVQDDGRVVVNGFFYDDNVNISLARFDSVFSSGRSVETFFATGRVGQPFEFQITLASGATVFAAELEDSRTLAEFGISFNSAEQKLTSASLLDSGMLDIQLKDANATLAGVVVLTIRAPGANSNTPQIISAAAANPNPGIVGSPIEFTVLATDADGDSLSYYWNFGDGSTVRGRVVTHTYLAAGSYDATITASDGKHNAGQHLRVKVFASLHGSVSADKRSKMTFDYRNFSKSSVLLSGQIPVASAQALIGARVSASVIGSEYSETFVLNQKLSAGTDYSRLEFKFKATGRVRDLALFTLMLKNDPHAPLHEKFIAISPPNRTIPPPGELISIVLELKIGNAAQQIIFPMRRIAKAGVYAKFKMR